MFKRLREKQAAREYEKQLTEWQDERDGYDERLQLARTYRGDSSSDIMLNPGEAVFAIVSGASLIEDRRVPKQGSSAPTAIDTGTVYVTNQRIIFQGGKQTRQCLWNKLLGLQHDDTVGKTVFSVSNRQKPLIILYGPEASSWFDFRLDLALAHYRDSVPVLVAQLEGHLADLDAHKPQPPAAQVP